MGAGGNQGGDNKAVDEGGRRERESRDKKAGVCFFRGGKKG